MADGVGETAAVTTQAAAGWVSGDAKRTGFARRFLKQLARNRAAGVSAVLLVLIILAAILAPLLTQYNPNAQNLLARLALPSARHWLGTDSLGRDEFARILYGGRISLAIGLFGSLGGLVLGVVLGGLSGYLGGWFDTLSMRFIDIMMSFPGVLLAILIAAVLGPGMGNVIVALTIWFTPTFARITRGNFLALRSREFVEAAKASGASGWRIMLRHMLTNSLAAIIVYMTLSVARSILVAAALGFLGLGVQPPTAEWGAMVSAAGGYIQLDPNLLLFPGAAICVTVLSINLVGDVLRDVLDPRLH